MKRSVVSGSGARTGRVLSPAFLAQRWKPGQSGNPSGQSAEYGEVVELARSLSMRAMERLGELMESEDPRVATVACNSVLDRAYGKPPVQRPEPESDFVKRLRAMTPEQRRQNAAELWEKARRVLLQDQRRREAAGEVIPENQRIPDPEKM